MDKIIHNLRHGTGAIMNIRGKKKASNENHNSNKTAFTALNISLDLVAGVVVGLTLGHLLDEFFNSKPLFLIVCVFLSIAMSLKIISKRIQDLGDGT